MRIKISGKNPISGMIECGGAKNLSIKIIIASILSRSIVRLKNIPIIDDVKSTLTICKAIGVKVHYEDKILVLDSSNLSIDKMELGQIKSRMPILILAVLLNFFDEIKVPNPVGCPLGDRKLNFHFQILEKFGHKIEENCESISGSRKNGEINGVKIELPYPSVGATETALFSSVLAKGITIISGIAIEPEIRSLIVFLQACGAKISYTGERELEVEGVDKLYGTEFEVDGDRIEAASWACLACASNGKITVSGVNLEHLSTFLGVYRAFGGDFRLTFNNQIEFFRSEAGLTPVFLETGPYPQLSTDYQPIIAAVLSLCNGNSVLHETLFNNRLGYLDSFIFFNINSTKYTQCIGNYCYFRSMHSYHSAIINGPTSVISPKKVIHADTIRSGFAYLILASVADGETEIENIDVIERGVEKLYDKMSLVGIKYKISE